MPRKDSTARDGLRHGSAASAQPDQWLEALHHRAVSKLTEPSARLALMDCSLAHCNCAGWPALALHSPHCLPLPRPVIAAYREALGACLADAAAALTVTPPVSVSDDLALLWREALAHLELPSTRMLLSQQAWLSACSDQTATITVLPSWLAMVQSRRTLIEEALAMALGSPRTVAFEPAAGEVA